MTLIDAEKWSYISFCATMVLSYMGHDDVAYKYMGKKPTSEQLIVHARYILVKMFAALSGGSVLTFYSRPYILKALSISSLSETQNKIQFVFCIVTVFLLMGVLQNIIRLLQGRQPRSLSEIETFRDNIRRSRNMKDWGG